MPGRAWWILLPLCSLCTPSPPRQGYLIVVPSVFRSGVEESVSVTIFNLVKETTVQIQLVVKGETVARAHGAVLGKGTIKLKVPPGLQGQAHLKVWGNRHLTEEGYIFHNVTTVTVDSKGASVFIQTDKPVYRPKQKVLINLFTVSPDLRPINEKVEAYVVDPRGSRMIEWNNLKPVCCGVLNMSFPLSDQPVFGEWFIFAEMQGHTYNRSFEVQKYVLPKFELQFDLPRYIRDLSICEKGTVHARYTFGKPVVGRLTVNMTVNGVGYYRHETGNPVLKTTDIDGSADFDVCIKDMMPTDVPEHFRGAVNIWATVTSVDGSRQIMFDDSTPVQKQLVDIKYTKDTRKQFKPGLPYKGKVEVTYPDGSPADGVTIRIKAELTPKDNIYTSELVSRGGLVEFEIPSIPSAAQYVWLETKVIALDGKPAGDQYLPNYLSISSWYSPSQCHIQLQMPDKPFLVGEEACITVKSTCPCNFTLHYEVVSRGNIVLSGLQPGNVTQQRSKRAVTMFSGRNIHISRFPAPTSPPALEMHTCVTSLHFSVTHSMAPLGRLLAYYVRENGEGVTDTLQFAVEPSFENQVSVAFSANETRPGDYVGVKVRAAQGSCVCLATVDKSVYLLKPGFQLTSAQIFQELADYDVSDVFGNPKEDGHFWWPGMSLRRRRRRSSIFPWHWDITKDARFAFTETGLVVMTDLVSLNHRQHGSMYTDEAVPAFQPHTGTLVASVHSKTVPRAEKKKRTFFPETWLWHCLNVSASAKAFAYGGSGCCQDGMQFAKNGKHSDDGHADKRAPVGIDYVRRSVIVEPEGLTREYTYSVFFCPNEKIHISTPNKYEYQYVQKPARMTHFNVAVKAHNNAHIALSSGPHDMAEMTEIVIGGYQNSRTWISTSKMGEPVTSAETAGILSWDEFRSFWVSWANGIIQVGHGPAVLNESIIVTWVVPRQPEVKYIGFSTGWGSVGEFKIWRKEEMDENHNEAFTLGIPHNVIPGSERATASVIADDPYTTVLTAYALTLLHSPSAVIALRKMNGMAITQDGFTHWSLMGTLATDEDTFMGFNDGLSQSVVSAEVEMTAYALLTYTVLGDVASALPVVKWLSQQRNALGGFSSTQDTCVALQALAEYAILSYIGGVNLTISLASTNLDYQETFELNKVNKKLLQTAVIDVAYNVPDPVAKPAFQLLVNLQEPKPKRHRRAPRPPKPLSPDENRSEASHRDRALGDDDDPASDQDRQEYKVIVEACMRWLHSGSSNMAVLEVPLFSGFQADIESLEQLLMNKQIGLKRYEMDGRKVLFYFDEIPSQCMTCVKFVAFREYIVGKTAPVPIKVYDYYEPAFEATRFYNVSENSPLARELCDGPMCNEVESSASHWVGLVHTGPCNSVFGCLEDGYFEQCMCSRDCGYDGEPVCGSDGLVYQNHCQMEVAACRNSTRIEQVPMAQCTVGPTLPLDFSYYSYEYEVDPYASEGDTFELTTASSTAAQDSDRLHGAAMTTGE
ncbi:hypothetical protein lerEdw1_008536 [Lerista edwardsae]|nr:hypothetical protein lerEdw1_008536 [Lerista edwardsae]